MSSTAQKEDIQDPVVIERFCARVRTQERLTALYLPPWPISAGTNPKLWNDWKADLLQNLFHAAGRYLAGEGRPTRAVVVSRRQQSALELLRHTGTPEKPKKRLWQALGPAYFARHELQEVLWHTADLVHNAERAQARSGLLPDTDTLR